MKGVCLYVKIYFYTHTSYIHRSLCVCAVVTYHSWAVERRKKFSEQGRCLTATLRPPPKKSTATNLHHLVPPPVLPDGRERIPSGNRNPIGGYVGGGGGGRERRGRGEEGTDRGSLRWEKNEKEIYRLWQQVQKKIGVEEKEVCFFLLHLKKKLTLKKTGPVAAFSTRKPPIVYGTQLPYASDRWLWGGSEPRALPPPPPNKGYFK